MAKIISPLSSFLCLFLFVFLPVYKDYLASSAAKYLINFRLILLNTSLLLFLTWLGFSIISAFMEKKEQREGLVLKVLALNGFFGILSLVFDEIALYFSYYYNFLIAPLFSLIISLIFGLLLYKKFLEHLKIKSWKLAFVIFLPVAVLLIFNFFQENNFFSKPSGRYEIYNSQLRYDPEIKKESLADFLVK